MEPSGGPGPGPVPVPGNNKGRGGAAAPGRGRDLARPPRKDSEVSAAAGSGVAFPGGAGRAGPRPVPAHGCRCPGAVPVSGRCPGVPVPRSVRLFQPGLGTAFPGTSPGLLAPVLQCWSQGWSLGTASLAQWPRAVEPRGLSLPGLLGAWAPRTLPGLGRCRFPLHPSLPQVGAAVAGLGRQGGSAGPKRE